jgi:soluble lytic murein transglycosylase-like protein
MRFIVAAGVCSLATIFAEPAMAADLNCGAAVPSQFSEASRLCGTSSVSASGRGGYAGLDRQAVSVGYARSRRPVRAVRRGGNVPIDPLIHAVGRSYRVDPHLLAAMVRAESAGRPGAISHKGALGLMQVMPGTARSLGIREPRALLRDPALALSTGALYLKTLQAKFGNNLPLVVAAYNAGPGAVTRAGMRVPAYRETQGYVSTVMGRYGRSRGR